MATCEQRKVWSRRYYERVKNDPARYQKLVESSREWKSRNKEKIKASSKLYRAANSKKICEYYLNRKRSNPVFRAICNFRNRLWMAAKDRCFSSTTQALVGCSCDELKSHIEQRFVDGMSWDNYGSVWHIDHVVPVSAFDLLNEDQARKCFHYSNLQPLFAMDNLKKSDSTT